MQVMVLRRMFWGVFLLGLFLCDVKANPIKIQSFSQINLDELSDEMLRESVWCIDVDKTLIIMDDSAYLHEDLLRKLAAEYKLTSKHYNIISIAAHYHLLEDYSVFFINELKKRGATVIICTSVPTALYCNDGDPSLIRHEKLKKMGIEGSFSDEWWSFKAYNYIKQKHEMYKGEEVFAVFCHGVLCTGGAQKADVMRDFLTQKKLNPSLFVMIDDAERVLYRGAGMCVAWNGKKKQGDAPIAFKAYQFKHSFQGPEVDEKLIRYQIQYLVEHDEWLYDDVARNRMNGSA
jgi:hypothetical protein